MSVSCPRGIGKVGDVMKSIASSYVFYYNKKYGRVGHLFQDRFNHGDRFCFE